MIPFQVYKTQFKSRGGKTCAQIKYSKSEIKWVICLLTVHLQESKSFAFYAYVQ